MENGYHYQKYQKYKRRYNNMIGGDDDYTTEVYPKPQHHPLEVNGCKKTIFFFDNDANNFRDMGRCMCVVPVEINESRPIERANGLPIFVNNQTYYDYVNQQLPMGAKLYGQSVIKNKGIDSYDPKSGLKTVDIKYYTQKLNCPKFRNRVGAFIFDWDRTLTLFEGVPAGYGNLENLLSQREGLPLNIKGSDVATYYFGGSERVNALECLFTKLKNFKIPVYILSANRGVEKYKTFFWDLLKSIGIFINPSNMIYRGELSKYQYIEEVLPDLCQGI